MEPRKTTPIPAATALLSCARKKQLGKYSRIRLYFRASLSFNPLANTLEEAQQIVFGQPNEAYSPLQTELRARFPDAAVVVMNLCNGSCGYLPPAPLYDEEIYAVWQSPFARGGLEMLIGAAEELLRETAEFSP